jgi:hypothetical protein
MNTAIQNTIAQYFSSFIENVSTKYNVSQDELNDLWKETQKEKLKIKPRRRANANKTPSAYINFCKHHRTIIKTENPTLTFGEVAKALGALWKSQDADEKKKYTDPAYISSSTTPNTNKVDATDDTKKAKRARKNKD